MAEVIVLGGGFGGRAAARELALGLPHRVTLITAEDRFFVGFAKLWDLVGARPPAQGTARLESLEDHGVRFLQATATGIDPVESRVEANGMDHRAGFLVVALGAADGLGQVAALEGAAYNLYDADALPDMRRALDALESGRVVVAVLGDPYKCAPAPYEAAFLIEEHLRRRGARRDVEVVVTTPLPATLPMAGTDVSDAVSGALSGRGIELRTDRAVTGLDAQGRKLALGDEELGYDLLLAIPQAVPPQVIADCALAGEDGWILPDRHSARTSFNGVYAAGDCTAVQSLRKAGVFAEAMGAVAARNIIAELTGSSPASYDGSGYCFLESRTGRRQLCKAASSPTRRRRCTWPSPTPKPTLGRKPSKLNGFTIGSAFSHG